jgi:hypothetical protein
MTFGDSLRSALKQARSLSDHARRTGGRSAMLGAVLLAASTATVLATANTPAKVTVMTANAAKLNAGEALIITGTFEDPDAGDATTLFVYWNDDGSNHQKAEKVQLAAGQRSFQLSHTYPVAGPQRDVVVFVGDRELPFYPFPSNDNTSNARDNRRFPLVVNPADPNQTPHPDQQPRFVESRIKVTKMPGKPGLINIQGDWTDADDNAGMVTLVPSDGQPPKVLPACTSTGHHFKCLYQFPVPNPPTPKSWIYALEVMDGRGGHGVFMGNVQIP